MTIGADVQLNMNEGGGKACSAAPNFALANAGKFWSCAWGEHSVGFFDVIHK